MKPSIWRTKYIFECVDEGPHFALTGINSFRKLSLHVFHYNIVILNGCHWPVFKKQNIIKFLIKDVRIIWFISDASQNVHLRYHIINFISVKQCTCQKIIFFESSLSIFHRKKKYILRSQSFNFRKICFSWNLQVIVHNVYRSTDILSTYMNKMIVVDTDWYRELWLRYRAFQSLYGCAILVFLSKCI